MKILLTGGSSGVGKELFQILSTYHDIDAPIRDQLDLSNTASVNSFTISSYDMLINCAGTDVGGKIDFVNHESLRVKEILDVNFVNVVLLTQKVLLSNPNCKIVNITSTNNNRYWSNNLAYSLSKKALEAFGDMLLVEYPTMLYLEVRLGLTKTEFNNNRYKYSSDRFQDIYLNPHLIPLLVAEKINSVLFDNSIKFIEIAP
jgi:short-subunit dehydrogenase